MQYDIGDPKRDPNLENYPHEFHDKDNFELRRSEYSGLPNGEFSKQRILWVMYNTINRDPNKGPSNGENFP